MEKIPTAEEFLEDNLSNPTKGWSEKKRLIEFAKLHVEAALKAASENALLVKAYNYGQFDEVTAKFDKETCSVFVKETYAHGDCSYMAVKTDKNSILNSYPLENIK